MISRRAYLINISLDFTGHLPDQVRGVYSTLARIEIITRGPKCIEVLRTKCLKKFYLNTIMPNGFNHKSNVYFKTV